jgi:hypothetical protein
MIINRQTTRYISCSHDYDAHNGYYAGDVMIRLCDACHKEVIKQILERYIRLDVAFNFPEDISGRMFRIIEAMERTVSGMSNGDVVRSIENNKWNTIERPIRNETYCT